MAEQAFFDVLDVLKPDATTEDILAEMANDTEYGLTGAVWSRSMEVANRVARRLNVGLVFVNNFVNGLLGVPFSGYEYSCIGRKFGLNDTMAKFTQVKSVRTSIAGFDRSLDDYYD